MSINLNAAVSVEIRDEMMRLRDTIGWSHPEMAHRLRWSITDYTRFRNLKLGIEERYLEYVRAVARAVESVPKPLARAAEGSTQEFEMSEGDEMDHGPQELRVIKRDTITVDLVAEYLEVSASREVSPQERTGALWAIGRLAQRLGVEDDVRAAIIGAKQAAGLLPSGAVRELAEPSSWVPPVSRAPFVNS